MATTIAKVNFEPTTDVLAAVHRRDFVLADRTLVDPTNALCLVDGEWMAIGVGYKMSRASAVGTPGARASVRSFPLWMERGRYDVQAIAQTKAPVIWLGHYEADTRVYDASVTLGSGAAITSVMQPLKVATITVNGRNYSGLVGHGGSADTDPVVGYVTRLPAENGGKLRFQAGYRS